MGKVYDDKNVNDKDDKIYILIYFVKVNKLNFFIFIYF